MDCLQNFVTAAKLCPASYGYPVRLSEALYAIAMDGRHCYQVLQPEAQKPVVSTKIELTMLALDLMLHLPARSHNHKKSFHL